MIQSIIDRLHEAEASSECHRSLYYETLLQTAVIELLRMVGCPELESADPGKRFSPSMIRDLDAFIEQHIGEKIEIKDLAHLTGIPVLAFHRAFKAEMGSTPYQYILMQRIKGARRLIASSSLSLADIAYMNGFSSQSHMTDVFKAKLGSTPGAIRRSAQ